MNYNHPTLLEALAGEHALGSLRGPARQRFERLCAATPAAAQARRRWEDRLLPLALASATVEPRADSWPAIQRRIAATSMGAAAVRKPMPGWRWLAAASIAVIALVIGRYTVLQPPALQLVAELAPAQAAAQWRVERSADARHITIRTLRAVTAASATSYELWALPAGSGNPVSLGLIPTAGRIERTLSDAQRAMLLAAANLAVSVEPQGGSPTGLPTGPVIIVAAISRAG
jgi:anti-sigma-K factor RskA